MKIAAFIEEPEILSGLSCEEEANLYQRMKQESKADALIAVICGNFRQDGRWMQEAYDKREEHLYSQGVDLVVELPVYCTLNTFDTYAFSVISTLEKLNCVDELLILCRGEEERIRKEITQFLFKESENVACDDINSHAVEFGKAVKRLYSTMKVRFLSLNLFNRQEKPDENQLSSFEIRLWQELKKKLGEIEEQKRKQYLNEISGGYAPMTEKILEAYQNDAEMKVLDECLVTKKRSRGALRRYFLRALLGIRQVEISICGLYSYALYVNVAESISEKEIKQEYEFQEARGMQMSDIVFNLAKKSSWIPVIVKNHSGITNGSAAGKYTEGMEQLDESRNMLLSIEDRAEVLYKRLVEL